MSLVDGSCLEQNYLLLQVEVDQEIVTSTNNDSISSSVMANTKQTNRKESGRQGSPAHFPNRGKHGGKAAKHLKASSEDDNNNVVKNAVKAGRRRHVGVERPGYTKGLLASRGNTAQVWEPYKRSGTTKGSTVSYAQSWPVHVYSGRFVIPR